MGTAFLNRMQPFMLDKTCLICRKPFVNRVALEQHMITKHIDVTEQQAQQLRRNLRKVDNSDLSEQKEWCVGRAHKSAQGLAAAVPAHHFVRLVLVPVLVPILATALPRQHSLPQDVPHQRRPPPALRVQAPGQGPGQH